MAFARRCRDSEPTDPCAFPFVFQLRPSAEESVGGINSEAWMHIATYDARLRSSDEGDVCVKDLCGRPDCAAESHHLDSKHNLVNAYEAVVHRRGVTQNPAPTVANHTVESIPEVESFVWGPSRDAPILKGDIMEVAGIIPTLALNVTFPACRALCNMDNVNDGKNMRFLRNPSGQGTS